MNEKKMYSCVFVNITISDYNSLYENQDFLTFYKYLCILSKMKIFMQKTV